VRRTPLEVLLRQLGGLVADELGRGQPRVAQAGGPVDGRRRRPPDPHLQPLGRQRADAGPVDLLAGEEPADDVEVVLERLRPGAEVCTHGPELVVAAPDGALQHERPRRDRGQRAELLGRQDRRPQRQEVEGTGGAVTPLGQEPAQNRRVLVVGPAGGVVVADEQGVQAGLPCHGGLLDHPPGAGAGVGRVVPAPERDPHVHG
jgi:hypothetical protein